MAEQRDPRDRDASDRVDRVARPPGYILENREHVDRLLAVEAELLRSEGIDPAWPGFSESHSRGRRRDS
jgi:hypothetical protein